MENEGYRRVGVDGECVGWIELGVGEGGMVIVRVGDREYKREEGEVGRMGGMKNVVGYEENLGGDEGVGLWKMLEGMGGEGSMGEMVDGKG